MKSLCGSEFVWASCRVEWCVESAPVPILTAAHPSYSQAPAAAQQELVSGTLKRMRLVTPSLMRTLFPGQVNAPKTTKTFCKAPKCRNHQTFKVTQYKAGKASLVAQGALPSHARDSEHETSQRRA